MKTPITQKICSAMWAAFKAALGIAAVTGIIVFSIVRNENLGWGIMDILFISHLVAEVMAAFVLCVNLKGIKSDDWVVFEFTLLDIAVQFPKALEQLTFRISKPKSQES